MALRPLLAPRLAKPTGHPAFAPTLGQQTSALELEFVFVPAADASAWGGPGPHPYRNPNRPGTALHFWREVKDALRRMITGHDKRGSYVAPGVGGKRNNIEPQVRPSRAHGQLANKPQVTKPHSEAELDSTQDSTDSQLDSLALRRAQLQMPSWPSLPRATPLPMAKGNSHRRPPIKFIGKELTPNKPISYRQEVLFTGSTAQFVSQAAAIQVMRELLELMNQNPTVHVQIIGNTATDFQESLNQTYYGSNKTVLKKFPLYGYNERNEPQYGTDYGARYRTVGDLMLARALAIGKLLTNQGISPSRVHYSLGAQSFGTLSVPGSGKLKRRATIVVTDRP